MWGVYITTFVFWVGIGHAGTLISAILYLFRSPWRTAIYRSAEAMTVFAVMTAGLFPIIHIGRPWKFYWLLPYPNWRLIWPNFKSPLVWDVFAISTYLTVSTTFLFFGLMPDMAAVRDKATGWRKKVYELVSLGWQGTDHEWRHFSRAYLFLAALATPLVLSVHSVVSLDFAMAIVPGWHGTIFAPYFVAGAIFSGIGMVFTLIIPLRRALRIEHMITDYHFDNLAKLILLTARSCSTPTAWSSSWRGTAATCSSRPRSSGARSATTGGPAGPCSSATPSSPSCCGSGRSATNITSLFVLSIFINIGMWFERFVIIVSSLSNEYMPWAWDQLNPTWVDWGILVGSFGWFGMWFLLFAKNFPIVAIQEIKEMIPMPRKRGGHH